MLFSGSLGPVKPSCIQFRLGFLCAANRGDGCRDIEVDSVKKLAHEVLVCLIHLFSITQNSFIYAFIYICNFVYMIKEQYGVSNGH